MSKLPPDLLRNSSLDIGHSTFAFVLTDPRRLGRPVRSVIPVLHARAVGHSPVASVPTVEAIQVERPETALHVRDHDEPVCVAHIQTERTLRHAAGLIRLPVIV